MRHSTQIENPLWMSEKLHNVAYKMDDSDMHLNTFGREVLANLVRLSPFPLLWTMVSLLKHVCVDVIESIADIYDFMVLFHKAIDFITLIFVC